MTTRSNGDNFKRALGILISLAVGVGIAMAMVVVKAKAQSRYDTDQQWIRKTLRQQRHEDHEREHRREVRYESWRQDREREYRHRHAHWRGNHNRYYGYRSDEHRETRVYGMTMYGPQMVQRDATSHVSCWPPMENTSREHTDENRAWNDAQLGWMAAVSVKYGARFADVQNVDARTLKRQCFRSNFDESWLGRNREALAQNTGTGLGYKVRCTIIASPCMAPITNDTPLKGDQPLPPPPGYGR